MSGKERWWKCNICGKSWFDKISNVSVGYITKNGSCNCNRLNEKNNLKNRYPLLSKYWNYEKNYPLIPENIFGRSGIEYWWVCDGCGYEWKKSCDLMSKTQKCPVCSADMLYLMFPEIVKEWNYEKNKDVDVNSLSVCSAKKCWWKCEFGHEWRAIIYNRTKRNSGCPFCSQSHGEKRIKKYLINNDVSFEIEYRIKECRSERPLPFDFKINIGNSYFLLEYQGKQHYEPSKFYGGDESFEKLKIRDKIKKNFCSINKIKLLEIPYWEYDNIEKILDNIFIKEK
jgi:hypothetical protein